MRSSRDQSPRQGPSEHYQNGTWTAGMADNEEFPNDGSLGLLRSDAYSASIPLRRHTTPRNAAAPTRPDAARQVAGALECPLLKAHRHRRRGMRGHRHAGGKALPMVTTLQRKRSLGPTLRA